MIHLHVGLYDEADQVRVEEYRSCLLHNLGNPCISRIIALVENDLAVPENPKMVRIEVGRRPTYDDFMGHFAPDPAVNVIANSDILFDETIACAEDIGERECYALTRWELDDGGRLQIDRTGGTQDVWIFRGVPTSIEADFHLGVPGCDNSFAYKVRATGYQLSNPASQIICRHVHQSAKRNYDARKYRVPPPYLHVRPT